MTNILILYQIISIRNGNWVWNLV